MGTLDPNWPLQLRCQFIEQGQDTLNMLRVSRINPKLSSYAALEGQFNFMGFDPMVSSDLALLESKLHRRRTVTGNPGKNHFLPYKCLGNLIK